MTDCSLAEIDFADRQYPFSYGRSLDLLCQSLAREGLVHPPLLAAGDNGLVIVCGRRRLEAARELWGSGGKCRVLLTAGVAPAVLFRFAFWENVGHRQFNVVETADIFAALEKLFPPAIVRDEFLGSLQVPPREKFFRRCRAIAGMTADLRQALAAGLLEGETAALLAVWPEAERRELLSLATELRLNRNRLKEIVHLAVDLAGRDGITPGEVLRRRRQAAASWPVSAAEFRQGLWQELHPCQTAAAERFAAWQQALRLPPGMDLQPPPAFEGNEYRLEIRFSNLSQWRAARKTILELEDERIDELFVF